MTQVAKDYFKTLFTSSRGLEDMSHILLVVDRCIMDEVNSELNAPFIERGF